MINELLLSLGKQKHTMAGTSTDKDAVFIVHNGEMYVVEAKHVGSCNYSRNEDPTDEEISKFFNDLNKNL